MTTGGGPSGDGTVTITYRPLFGPGRHHVLTSKPSFYIQNFQAVCTELLPHGHVPLYNCFFTVAAP
jgi:hypothetical protein